MYILRCLQFVGLEGFKFGESQHPVIQDLIRYYKELEMWQYRIQLPEEMSDIHPVFHVSQLKKCLRVPEEQVFVDAIDLQDDLRCQKLPIKILDTVTKHTRNSTVRLCRVQWSRHSEAEATWEREDALRKEFPHLFRNQPNLEDKIHFMWGRFVTA